MPPEKVNIFELISLRRNHDQLADQDKDANPIQPQPPTRRFRGSLGNWKASLYMNSTLCFVVLCVNVGFFSWANSAHDESVLYTGDCDKAKRMGTGVHLVINILSTLMLAGSNFTMQCLCAPTREDLDHAHRSNRWLDIGVPSIRNLRSISKLKLLLWSCLVFSSLPLHLFYNSTVYSTISGNSYEVYAGNSTFSSIGSSQDLSLNFVPDPVSRLVQESANGTLKKLQPNDCISAYTTYYQTKYGSLILITDGVNITSGYLQRLTAEQVMDTSDQKLPYAWMCVPYPSTLAEEKDCSSRMSEMQSHSDEVVLDGYKIDYCLAEMPPQTCTLEFSFPLALIVIIANFVKVIVIGVTASYLKCAPLLTTGDAVASFIKRPDEVTKGKCLLSRKSVSVPWSRDNQLRYNEKPSQWWSSLSARRWVACLLSYLTSIAVCLGLLAYGHALDGKDENSDGSWFAGLAAIEPTTFIKGDDWPGTIVPNILIANIPQLIFSILYFMANSVWTSMTLAAEWNSYSVHRKGLRVSTFLRGHQRSTYFLSLPYRYALPLISCSGLLHWLISQSLYVVIIRARGVNHERDPALDSATCAYSPVGIISSVSVGAFMLACLIGIGCRRFKSGMPVAGSCSLAIAAACHSSYVEKDDGVNDENENLEKLGAEYQPLKWGVETLIPGEIEAEIGHCTFSSGEAEMPRKGTVYL